MPSLFGVPVDAAYHVVTALSHLLAPVTGGLAVAAAIVVFTVAVRLLLLPFSYYALRGQTAQARLAPQAQALRKRHARDPERLRRELAALYEQNGTSMYAGCLPLLLQWPFLSVMYLLFRSATVDGAPNHLLSHYLFGAQLGSHWLAGAGPLSAQGAVFAVLLLLLAAVGWLSTRLARRLSPPPEPAPPAKAGPPAKAIPPAWLAHLVPLLTPVIAAFMPLAAGLYLLTTTTWTLAERRLLLARLQRPAPPLPAPPPPRPRAKSLSR
jgi:YidC/Oxa1 family membrane protein insertase